MSGTKAGGLKASATNKRLHGDDFYKRIGQIGDRKSHKGGFGANPELARIAGVKGGCISRRGKAKAKKTDYEQPLEVRRQLEKNRKRQRRFAWLFGRFSND